MVFQTEYFKSLSGILKIFEIIFSAIGMLMTIIFNTYSELYFPISRIFSWISGVALVATFIIGFLYFLSISEVLHPILKYEKYFYLIFMIFVLPYSSILVYNGSSKIQLEIAGISGVLLSITFLADGINGFQKENQQMRV